MSDVSAVELTLERVRFNDDPRQIERVRLYVRRLRRIFHTASFSSLVSTFVRWGVHFLETGEMPEEAVVLQRAIGGSVEGGKGQGG